MRARRAMLASARLTRQSTEESRARCRHPAHRDRRHDRNLEAADRLVRAAAADGAQLVVLPEKWTVLGTRRGPARRRPAARRPGAHLGARDGPRARHRPGRRLDRRARRRARRSCATPSVHVGPDGEIRAIYRKLHLFDVEVDGRATASPTTRTPGDEPVLTRTAEGVEVGMSVCYDLRFPELYRALAAPRRAHPRRAQPRSPSPRRATTGRSWCAPARSRTRPSSSPPTRSASTRPALRSGGRSHDRRPVGRGPGLAPDAETPRHGRPRPRRSGRDPRAAARAAPPPARRSTPDGLAQRPERGRQAAADPRRRRARLRPPGLQRVPRVGHRRRGGRRLRARLPLLPLQGRGARHALPRALERAARRDPRDSTRAGHPAAREAPRDRVVHRRLLPPRPRPDEGHHRRGHARGELLRPDPPRPKIREAYDADRARSSRRPRPTASSRTTVTPQFAAMAFYGAIEQVLTGWIFDVLPRATPSTSRPRPSSSRRSAPASTACAAAV